MFCDFVFCNSREWLCSNVDTLWLRWVPATEYGFNVAVALLLFHISGLVATCVDTLWLRGLATGFRLKRLVR